MYDVQIIFKRNSEKISFIARTCEKYTMWGVMTESLTRRLG